MEFLGAERKSNGAARACEPAAPAYNGHAPQTRIRGVSGCCPFGSLFPLLLLSPFSVDVLFGPVAEVLVGCIANMR